MIMTGFTGKAKKGDVRNPKGKKAGTPNKATTNAREAIAAFVEGNVDRLNGWLDQIAADDPAKAFACFMDVVEYHIPKLARTELMGEVTGVINVNINKSIAAPVENMIEVKGEVIESEDA